MHVEAGDSRHCLPSNNFVVILPGTCLLSRPTSFGKTTGLIVGLSCAIIAGLFMSQGFGPAKLGFAFSPILFVV